MLARMYMRWAERRGYKVALIEESPGEEAGIKSATLEIKGENAYGWLKTESGVHRLVRISPYDANARRHTSFASVWVYPVIDEDIEIDIKESECRIDTYRSSGAGGQHVNTTDSAVRITHMPTGIVVASQQERSQIKNRAIAWAMLKSRLYEQELKKREEKASAEAASKTEIGWGHQIRSYVLQPYQLVKDLRTGVQSGNPGAVLDGDIDAFVEVPAQRHRGQRPGAGRDLGRSCVHARGARARTWCGFRRARATSRPSLGSRRAASGNATRWRATSKAAWACSSIEIGGEQRLMATRRTANAAPPWQRGFGPATAPGAAASIGRQCPEAVHAHMPRENGDRCCEPDRVGEDKPSRPRNEIAPGGVLAAAASKMACPFANRRRTKKRSGRRPPRRREIARAHCRSWSS
jgi:protein subunit release factor B